MNRRKLALVALFACAATWLTVGALKLAQPRPIHIAGLTLDGNWATAIAFAEIGLAAALLLDVTRRHARIAALVMLTLFTTASWTAGGSDCGCLGIVKLDQATRQLLLGLLLTVHGLEWFASSPAPRCVAPTASSDVTARVAESS